VQFSTEFCQPCKAARRVLARTAADTPGVTHVEIDATERDDLVRHFGIRRTPTVLVLDDAGRVVARTAGVPDCDDLLEAIRRSTPADPGSPPASPRSCWP
jgi:thiol-disulfide isomerase/thioredoxin